METNEKPISNGFSRKVLHLWPKNVLFFCHQIIEHFIWNQWIASSHRYLPYGYYYLEIIRSILSMVSATSVMWIRFNGTKISGILFCPLNLPLKKKRLSIVSMIITIVSDRKPSKILAFWVTSDLWWSIFCDFALTVDHLRSSSSENWTLTFLPHWFIILIIIFSL